MNTSVGLTGPIQAAGPNTNSEEPGQVVGAAANPLANDASPNGRQIEFAALFANRNEAAGKGSTKEDVAKEQADASSIINVDENSDAADLSKQVASKGETEETPTDQASVIAVTKVGSPSHIHPLASALPDSSNQPDTVKDAGRNISYDIIGLPAQHANHDPEKAVKANNAASDQSLRIVTAGPVSGLEVKPKGIPDTARDLPRKPPEGSDQNPPQTTFDAKPLTPARPDGTSTPIVPVTAQQKSSKNLTAIQAGFYQGANVTVPAPSISQSANSLTRDMPSLSKAAVNAATPTTPNPAAATKEMPVKQTATAQIDVHTPHRRDSFQMPSVASSNHASSAYVFANPANTPPPSATPQAISTSISTTDLKSKMEANHSFLTPSDTPDMLSWEAPRAATPHGASPLAKADLAPHVARQLVEVMAQAVHKPTEIALSPQELGRVRMSVIAEDGTITVNILTERPETLDLMRRHIDQLGQTFRTMGYESINFAFGQGAQSGDETGQGQNGEQQESGNPTDSTNVSATKNTPSIIHLNSAPMQGVDIRL